MPARRASRGRILLCVNASWNVVNFRAGLIGRLLREGYAVTVAAPRDDHSSAIEQMGCRYVELPMNRHGRSIAADLGLLARLVRLFASERPDFYLGYTAKPNVYGSLAAMLMRVPAINNITGLGLIFNERGFTSRLLRLLYRIILPRSAWVFFQNRDNMAMFLVAGLANPDRVELLPGSGVDLARFAAAPPPPPHGRGVAFLLVARLLWEKGIAELIAAARLLRAAYPDLAVRLLGFVEADNAAFVQPAELEQWQREGIAVYLGTAGDVRPHIAAADCVVLPSYYNEGTPRVLLEAAAMARPIITCDMPGCRDVVVDGRTGLLVPPRDAAALAEAMRRMIELAPAARAAMGRQARARAEQVFDEKIVADRYVAALDSIRAARAGGRR